MYPANDSADVVRIFLPRICHYRSVHIIIAIYGREDIVESYYRK